MVASSEWCCAGVGRSAGILGHTDMMVRAPDAYAEPSDRFSEFDSAVRCLVEDARLPVATGVDVTQLGLPLENVA